ncbi:MAG: hypothetical protein HYY96_11075 [Candidatus Tectomicrobia bacterium]|nr:hypothetical protein [Candidatus Tectomicrobia bacterium]
MFILGVKSSGFSRSHECPHCGSSSVSRSHRTRRDYLLYAYRVARLMRPYRCRRCHTRFWQPTMSRRRLIVTYVGIVVVCLLAAFGSFMVSDQSSTISAGAFRSLVSQEVENLAAPAAATAPGAPATPAVQPAAAPAKP